MLKRWTMAQRLASNTVLDLISWNFHAFRWWSRGMISHLKSCCKVIQCSHFLILQFKTPIFSHMIATTPCSSNMPRCLTWNFLCDWRSWRVIGPDVRTYVLLWGHPQISLIENSVFSVISCLCQYIAIIWLSKKTTTKTKTAFSRQGGEFCPQPFWT